MSTALESVLDFCDKFPIISIVAIIICIFCSIPPLILLIAIQRSAVHDNCRFLISIWAMCLCAVLFDIAVLYGHTFTFTNGFLPRSVAEPNPRNYLFWAHGTLYFASSSLEMLMVVERMYSTRQPHVYHETGRATKTIILATVIAFALGLINDYFLYIQGPRVEGLFVHNILDVLTVIANILCIRYSKTRYEAFYGKASLNARYQVKETYLMAKAMQPVYVTSLLLKLTGVALGYVYSIFICCSLDARYYVLIDVGYFGIHAVNVVFSATFLICKHASVRKAALSLFRKERYIRQPQSNDVVDGTCGYETTDAYFSMLGQSWK